MPDCAAQVWLLGLEDPSLNGLPGTIACWSQQHQRFAVLLDNGRDLMVQRANLRAEVRRPLLSAPCSLVTALYNLPSALCSLLTAHCSLFSALSSLLSALYFLLSKLSALCSLA